MPETEVTGAPPAATPAPAAPPAAPAPTSDIRSAAKDAIRSIREKQSSAPEPAAPAAPATPEPSESPRLLTKEAPPQEAKVDLASIDWSKQSPEAQALRKELLGDYTRKTQELSEMRKASIEEREKFLAQALDRLAPKKEEPAVADPRETIRQLREEGRHEEADAMVLELSEKIATEKVAGLEKQAQINNLKTTFRDTVSDVNLNDKVVGAYKDQVAQVWDSDHPVMKEIRGLAVSSPERIKTIVPAVMHFLAVEKHAISLENRMNAAIKSGIEAGIKAEKDKAAGIHGSLVPSGGTSREVPVKSDGDVRRAVMMASRQLRGE
jgi:hypothetical protein